MRRRLHGGYMIQCLLKLHLEFLRKRNPPATHQTFRWECFIEQWASDFVFVVFRLLCPVARKFGVIFSNSAQK